MTRCKQFYEKVEKDGNFCGMPDTAFRKLKSYIEYCKAKEIPIGTISQGEAIKRKKRDIEALKDKKKGLLRGRIAPKEQSSNEIDAEVNTELEKTTETRMKIYELVGDSDDNFIRRCKTFGFGCKEAKRFLEIIDCEDLGGDKSE